ncbi:MAG: hypothetical protein U0800_19540 [Isosphaeraceae bacterium]
MILTIGLSAAVMLGIAGNAEEFLPELSSDAAWARMPKPEEGGGQPLPSWARMMAGELPKTTAAFLQLDYAQSGAKRCPIEPGPPPRCAGSPPTPIAATMPRLCRGRREAGRRRRGRDRRPRPGGSPGWPEGDRKALQFARKMTLASDTVTDEEFAALAKAFGDRKAASMVLLMAFANYQDRLLLCSV